MDKTYFRFDSYLTSKMLGLEWEDKAENDFSEEIRKEAYQKCLKLMGGEPVAAYGTIKKWFGIQGWARPNREKLIQLAFALHFSDSETREMFVKGALEPDFQINDYREIVFLYGLKHGLRYQDCLDMIKKFEEELPKTLELEQHNYTTEMWKGYGDSCCLEPPEFLAWMLERAEDFKGYSMTVLNYFQDLKQEILRESKRDNEARLEEFLGETGYFRWEKSRPSSRQKRAKLIFKFLEEMSQGKESGISEEQAEVIRELVKMSETPDDTNTKLLAELYSDVQQRFRKPGTRRHQGDIFLMDDKYLSDLLNVAVQKKRLLEMRIHGLDCGENQEQQESAIREQKKRCRTIKREDLLPLVLCVAQKRSITKLDVEQYNAEREKEQFVNLANRILTSCQMVPLDETRYELDALLCSCYDEEEMFFLPDVLEKYLMDGRKS